MALYCSDGRWGEAFDEFCHEGLQIPRYDRFAVPGGPLWLVPRDITLRIPHSAARDQLSFLVKAHGLQRVVLFGHYGCAYYTHLLGQRPDACLETQEADLRAAARTLSLWFPGLAIEAFMALLNDGRFSFRPVL